MAIPGGIDRDGYSYNGISPPEKSTSRNDHRDSIVLFLVMDGNCLSFPLFLPDQPRSHTFWNPVHTARANIILYNSIQEEVYD